MAASPSVHSLRDLDENFVAEKAGQRAQIAKLNPIARATFWTQAERVIAEFEIEPRKNPERVRIAQAKLISQERRGRCDPDHAAIPCSVLTSCSR